MPISFAENHTHADRGDLPSNPSPLSEAGG
jgi:hypothetical protein